VVSGAQLQVLLLLVVPLVVPQLVELQLAM
jgi:hypothetical protein